MTVKNDIEELIGRVLYYRSGNKGTMKLWGKVTKIQGDKVEVYCSTNPKGYKYRIESLSNIEKWLKQDLIEFRGDREKLRDISIRLLE